MIYSDFKLFQAPSTSSLTSASIYTQEQLNFLSEGTSHWFPFGESNKDTIEFYVYSTNGTLITSSYTTSEPQYPSNQGTYTPITSSYIDVTNQVNTYSYSLYQGDYVIVNQNFSGSISQSILFNVQQNLLNLSIQPGNYIIGVLPVRNLVGDPFDPSQKLVITQISSDRQELTAIPYVSAKTVDVKEQNLNNEFTLFSNSSIQPKSIISYLTTGLQNVNIYNTCAAVANANPEVNASILFYYSFQNNIAITNFVNDLYYGVQIGGLKSNGLVSTQTIFGVYNQYQNFLYQNYESVTTFQQLMDYYYSLFVYILNKSLNQITNTPPPNYDAIVSYFQQIFYDRIFLPVISSIQSNYNQHIFGYLNNSMNFGEGILLPILNSGVVPSGNSSVQNQLVLRLLNPLSTTYVVGDTFWISNTSICSPIVQDINFFTTQSITITPVRGPNFNYKIENEGNSTIAHSLSTIVNQTGSLYDELYSKLQYKLNIESPINVDYRYFENFIKFSSAQARLNVYAYKLNSITQIRTQISAVNAALLLNPDDQFYQQQLTEFNCQIDKLETSMDGYEGFLYNNPGWYTQHTTVYSGLTSGSRYDRDNYDSLQNNLPPTITDDVKNVDYVTFVNLLGHYFDNLTVYITQFTEKNNASNSELVGVSKDIVYNMLSSLGWDPQIGNENLPLILSSFSKEDFDADSPLWQLAPTLSESDRNKLIWKRILNSLPLIVKSKGTETAINALINCYGIPKNIIQIKEYGGIEYTTQLNDPSSSFIITETKFSPYFSGSGEYFDIPWTGSAQSFEFNFSFDPTNTSPQGSIFRLATANPNWAIGIIRNPVQTDWGTAYFTIQDTGSNILTSITQPAPFFTGDVYSLVLRHSTIESSFNVNPTASFTITDNYPQCYDMLINRNIGSRTTFQVSSSIFLSGSYNSSFRTPTHVYLGNYQQDTSSLNIIDPEAFFGTIDEVQIWENFLPDDRFNNHASFKGAYDESDPYEMVENLLLRLTFPVPVDLYTSSAQVFIENSAFRDFGSLIVANNFPFVGTSCYNVECNMYDNIPGYPYQFEEFDTTQTMELPNFGSNKFRSNKINYKDQTLISNLSPSSRSTLKAIEDSTVDSNKLGIFFSPTDQINLEIIKFFGNFQLGDLIGNPKDVFKRNYKRFEKFREIFYNQGLGEIDYQGFMNLIRSYFDKSLFTYIQTLVPARAKLVSGLMIEPSILERPKLQLKPVYQETIVQQCGNVDNKNTLENSTVIVPLTASIENIVNGLSVYDNINSSFFPDQLETYGFSILGENGVTYYQGDYWRVEVIPIQKSYTILNTVIPTSSMSNYSAYTTERGLFTTVTKKYEQVNISRFPTVTKFPNLTLVSIGVLTTNLVFSGSIVGTGFNLAGTQYLTTDVTMSGQFYTDPYIVSSSGDYGAINSSNQLGIIITIPSGSLTFIEGTKSLTGVYNVEFSVQPFSSVTASIYTLNSTSIFDSLVGTASGSFFSKIRDADYSYRYALAEKNSPPGSYRLNGYYSTHYKHKRPLINRDVIVTLDNFNNANGTFQSGVQTSQTTVFSGSGLLDGSLPVVFTAISSSSG